MGSGGAGSRRRIAGLAGLAVVALVAAFLLFRDPAAPTPSPDSPVPPREAASPQAPAPAPPAPPRAAEPSRPEEPAAPPPAAVPGDGPRLGLSVEVVDAEGRRVREGTLRLRPGMDLLLNMKELRDRGSLLRPQDLAAANPVVVGDLPASLGGMEVTVQAQVPGLPPGERRRVVLEQGGTTEVRLVVAPPRSVEVQVSEALGGAPVAGARVLSITELERRDVDAAALSGDRGPGWATTDAEGRALLTELGPGLHDLEITAPGHLALTPRGVEPSPAPLSFRLERGGRGATVVVRVRDPAGAPVPGVRVEMVHFGQDSELRGETDAQGLVEFAGLPEGHGLVRVDFLQWLDLAKERGWPRANVGELNDPVELAEGERKEIVLGFRGGTGVVACEVVDGTGAPVPDVEVTFSGATFLSGRTDGKGVVEFRGAAAGGFRLSLEGKTDWMDTQDRTLEEGGRMSVRLTLGHRSVRGRVLRADAEGKGVEGAMVVLSGPRYGQARTDASGAFAFEETLPGDYEVDAVADGFVTASVPLVVEAGKDPPPVELRLQRGGRIRIRLGPAAAGSREPALRVLDREGRELELRRDETGEFFRETQRQPPGTYTVEVAPADGAARVRTVEVKDGEDAVVDLGE